MRDRKKKVPSIIKIAKVTIDLFNKFRKLNIMIELNNLMKIY